MTHVRTSDARASGATTTVLLIDSTGRGHALCDLFVRTDPDVVVHYGPGCNVVDHPRIVHAPEVSVTDPRTALAHLERHPAEFVFMSHIDGLSLGYVDTLRAAGHRVIGPTGAAAALEASKLRGKEFCAAHGVPVAEFESFTDASKAKEYIRTRPYPCVVKTDGLTPDGDGSVVCDTTAQAEAAVDRFAASEGDDLHLVVEERLSGREISLFALLDGDGALLFPTAQDYKRALENDAGGNCDGMGSIAPHPLDGPELREELRAALLTPVLRGLKAEGLDFTGFVYVGAMLTDRGPVVIEINARFGDSEAEVVFPGVRSDFTELCRAVLDRRVAEQRLVCDELARCSVALVQGDPGPVSPGRPKGWPFGPYPTGQPVTGIEQVDPGAAQVFCANVHRDEQGVPRTTGGRVLHVVGSGGTPDLARRRAYEQLEHIAFPGMRYRTDIGITAPPAATGSESAQEVPA
ncbi:hypothetical protein N566_20885 [Streptomycetaceae bacterium MP113-05]|nr:hypothetical protein N566_20885 [Streptomycetaceae bacterium MP113-05]